MNDPKAKRESVLLAFEIAIEKGEAGSGMCSYNLVNGAYDFGNAHLLNGVLKIDWKWPDFVMLDQGAVHNSTDAMARLNQQSAAAFDEKPYQGPYRCGDLP